MASQPRTPLTAEEYLALERKAETKSEFYNGEVFAMAGASRDHILIAVNISSSLNGQLKERPCRVFSSDLRVKVAPSGLYTYPDVVVVCGDVQVEDSHGDTVLNPTVIVEVLSPSTEGYDRGKKFGFYRKLDSLKEYLLVSQDKCLVEHYVRQPDDTWLLSESDRLEDALKLPSIDCTLVVSDVYHKVTFS